MINKIFWDNTFKNNRKSQRNFPNEELCRFLGRNYKKKSVINVLELGCGTGSNVAAFTHYKMNYTGIDFSENAIQICKKKYKKNKKLKFLKLNMLEINKLKKKYDLVVDIFSTYNLNLNQNKILIKKIEKKLKKNGIYFMYTPSKKSTSWIKEKNRFDKSTLISFEREKSPFYGNKGFFRFISINEIKKYFSNKKFEIKYCENSSRTYNGTREYFEFFSVEIRKIRDN